MSHSYIRNIISLADFTPKRGTTKTVELTLIERKNIGRRKLAEHIARLFAHDPIRVTIKKHGRYITIANIGWGFQVTRRPYGFGPAVENGFKTLEEFTDHLAGTFASTEILRMAKLIRKQNNDKRSREKNKKSDLRITS
jgi:hypothetical protein